MYTYNKDDKTYTFSSDELNIDDLINKNINTNNTDANIDENINANSDEGTSKKPKNIEVVNGGNDLNISPVSEYIEIEKPKKDKKENIVIPEDKQ